MYFCFLTIPIVVESWFIPSLSPIQQGLSFLGEWKQGGVLVVTGGESVEISMLNSIEIKKLYSREGKKNAFW